MKSITALIKKSLGWILLILLVLFPAVVHGAELTGVDPGDVIVSGFVDVDPYSKVELDNAQTEVAIWRNVRVRVNDREGNPLSKHKVIFYSSSAIQFEQPDSLTDSDGYVRGRLMSMSPGVYTIRAYDYTYSEKISIQDTTTLYVFPVPIPQFRAEPYYTPGTNNTVYWDKVTGFVNSYEYQVEVALDSSFKNRVNMTAWLTGTQVKIEGLENAKMYFYRVRARNSGGGISGWSNVVFSVQDIVKPVIKPVEQPKIVKEKKKLNIQFKFNVTDNLALKEVKLFCDTSKGPVKCGWLQSTGSNYTATILVDELEKDKFFNFKDRYSFCVEAKDEAGNTANSCDFTMKFELPVEIPVPTVTNIVNSIINALNTWVYRLDGYIEYMLGGISDFYLTIIAFILLVISLTISFDIILGQIALIPTLLLHRYYKILSFIGLRKHGTPIGVVYDSITKKPVKYSRVFIYDNNNFLLRKEVTYYDGVISAKLDIGRYRIIVEHKGYLFPSNIVKKDVDEGYKNIYKGESILVGRRKVLNLSIPLDQKNIIIGDERRMRNHFRITKFLKHLNVLVTVVGFLFSIYALQREVNMINLGISLMYIPAFGVYLKSIVHLNLGMK